MKLHNRVYFCACLDRLSRYRGNGYYTTSPLALRDLTVDLGIAFPSSKYVFIISPLHSLEFSGNGVSWVQKPVASENIRDSVRPSYLALAVLDAYSALWERFIGQFRTTSSVSERACLSDSYMDFKTLDKLGGASQSESPSTHLQPSSILATLRWLPLPKLGPGSDLHDATQVFKKRIDECQRSDSRAYRQGIFFIRGPVGLKGSRGSCRIQVEGEYDPVASEWVSVSMHLNDLTFLSQKPLGRK